MICVIWHGGQDKMRKEYNNLKKTKTFFGIMLFIFFVVILTGQYYKGVNAKVLENYPLYKTMNSIASFEDTAINLLLYHYDTNPSQYSNCVFTPPQERIIILRLDDLGAWNYNNIVEKITRDILSRDLSISEGIIANNIEKDKTFLKWARKVKNNPKVEFALHGYYHNKEEFKELNYEEAKYYLDKGKEKIINLLGVVPVTFIPPYNVYSKGTEQALVDSGFKIISSGKNDIKYNKNIAYIGYGARTYDYENSGYVPSELTLIDCKESLNKNRLCVIMIHPQDYLEPAVFGTRIRNIDEEKYSDFENLLDNLKYLNASSKTYKYLLQCS